MTGVQTCALPILHILSAGHIVDTGGPELAEEIERTGYAAYGVEEQQEPAQERERPVIDDPFADPLA